MTEQSQEKIRPECEQRFNASERADEAILDKLEKMEKTQNKIHDKLFVDNNGKCHQTLLNNHERILKALIGILAAIGGTILTVLGFVAKDWFGGH